MDLYATTLTPFHVTIAALDAVAAFVAAWLHVRASRVQIRGSRSWGTHLATGILSVIYGVGYFVLALAWVAPVPWSEFFRGVSILTWPLVWWWPAIAAHRTAEANRVAAAQLVHQAEALRVARSLHEQ